MHTSVVGHSDVFVPDPSDAQTIAKQKGAVQWVNLFKTCEDQLERTLLLVSQRNGAATLESMNPYGRRMLAHLMRARKQCIESERGIEIA